MFYTYHFISKYIGTTFQKKKLRHRVGDLSRDQRQYLGPINFLINCWSVLTCFYTKLAIRDKEPIMQIHKCAIFSSGVALDFRTVPRVKAHFNFWKWVLLLGIANHWTSKEREVVVPFLPPTGHDLVVYIRCFSWLISFISFSLHICYINYKTYFLEKLPV